MIALTTICYIVGVLVTFKVIKIKVTPTSVAVAIMTGVLLLGGIVMAWNFSAPMTGRMTVYRKVIPLISAQDSKMYITKIHVKQDVPVKQGDPLYEVDKRPNQWALDQLTAQLDVANENVSMLSAAVEVATATVEKAKADQDYQKAALDTAIEIQKVDVQAIAALKVTVQQQTYASSQAAVEQALAAEQGAKFALTSAKEAIGEISAQISTAKLNLEQCVVRAPTDGQIINWQSMEGTMTTTLSAATQGIFMDTTETYVIAVFPMNLLKNVEPGNKVEIAFKGAPGRIAAGKVDAVLPYTGEGQIPPEGTLPVAATLGSKGFLAVKISMDDAELAKGLALGAGGNTAIYTNSGNPFHIITLITIRIKAWMNYVPF